MNLKEINLLFITFLNVTAIYYVNNSAINIEPQFQYHDRRKSLLVTCNGSSVTTNVTMYFHYHGNKYTVPRINNTSNGIYIGNFTAKAQDQSEVLIICTDLNSHDSDVTKLYLLGYPPSFIPQRYTVDLKCRDYNFNLMICCVTPDVSTLEQLLGFEGNREAGFKVKLFYSDLESLDESLKKSCYDLSSIIPAPTIILVVAIENVLGNKTYNFHFDRLAIQRPNQPKFYLTKQDKTSFTFYVDLQVYGEYEVTVSCLSLSPLTMRKNFKFQVYHSKSKAIVCDKWAQNSNISCTLYSRMLFGNVTVGDDSESLSMNLTLLEGAPSWGPQLSPLLIDYHGLSSDGYLSNITVFYMNVPLIDRNGLIIKYKWKCDNCFFKKRNASNNIYDLPANSRSLRLDRALLGSTISVTACTKVGCCDTWSRVQFQFLKDNTDYSRQLSIIRHTKNPDHVTIIWQNRRNDDNDLMLLLCTMAQEEHECSSIEQINLSKNESRIEDFHVGKNIKSKFALLSSGKHSNHKLKWVACFYNTFSRYDSEKELHSIPHKMIWSMDCGFYRCSVNISLKIPSCEEFSYLFFDSLFVTFNGLGSGILIPVSSDKVQFILPNLTTGWKTYYVNVSVITITNKSVVWFQTFHTTSFMCPLHVVFIIVVIVAVMLLVAIILSKTKDKIKKEYYKKKFKEKPTVITTNNDLARTVQLLNTDTNNQFIEGQETVDLVDNHSTPSEDQESTFSTPIDYSDNYNNSYEERLDDVSGNESPSYITRPLQDVCQYSHLAIPSKKNNMISLAPSQCANSIAV